MSVSAEGKFVATNLLSSFPDKVHASIELAQLMMTPTRVREDLHTIETHQDMWTSRREKLLAEFNSDTCIVCAYYAVAKGDLDLICDRLHNAWKIVVFPFMMLSPCCEMAEFAVVAIIRKPHLGTDEYDLAIVNNHTAVICDILVHDWPRNRVMGTP